MSNKSWRYTSDQQPLFLREAIIFHDKCAEMLRIMRDYSFNSNGFGQSEIESVIEDCYYAFHPYFLVGTDYTDDAFELINDRHKEYYANHPEWYLLNWTDKEDVVIPT